MNDPALQACDDFIREKRIDTSKDRWRQVLTEADRIPQKHLCTLEAGISTKQTDETRRQSLTLVVPAGLHPSLAAAAAAMSRAARVREPDPSRRAGFDRDYRAFLLMHEQRRALEAV